MLADSSALPEIAEQRQKGRFPLLVSGQILAGNHRRAVSAHGVGMLMTSLHRRAIEARDACVRITRHHFSGVVSNREHIWEDITAELRLETSIWQDTIRRLCSLTNVEEEEPKERQTSIQH